MSKDPPRPAIRHRFKSSPGLPPLVPVTSTSSFVAVRAPTPPELTAVTIEPNEDETLRQRAHDRANGTVLAYRCDRIEERQKDLENRFRVVETDIDARIALALEIDKSRGVFDVWTRGKKASWAIVMLIIGASVTLLVKYIVEPKPQAPALQYDKDGIPIPR